MGEYDHERRQLAPVLEVFVAAEDQRHQRRRGGRVLEERRHGILAVGVRLEEHQRLGEEREAHLGQDLEEVVLARLAVVRSEEHDERPRLAGRQGARGGEVAVLRPQVRARLGHALGIQLQVAQAERQARVERVVDAAGALEGEREAVCDLLAVFLGQRLEALRALKLAHGREDRLRVCHLGEGGEPAIAVRLRRLLHVDRLGAARRDLDKLVLAQVGARLLPERLPVRLLHEAVLRAQLLKARDGHVAEALQHRLHELARLLLEHLLDAGRIGAVRHEDVVLRREHERLAGRVESHLMALAGGEVHRDAPIEGIDALDLAQAPGCAED